jgi:hypothetical protein
VPVQGDTVITARVTEQTDTDEWAKAGVMIREGLDESARHALLARTPGNGLTFQWREEAGRGSDDDDAGPAVGAAWVRLVRVGSALIGYRSADGEHWERVASTTVPMGSVVRVGLAVTSHDRRSVSQATFDNVAVSTPEALERLDGTYVSTAAVTASEATSTASATPAATACPTGLWAVSYFANKTLTGAPVARGCEDAIAYDWGLDSPGGQVPADSFSARWQQTVSLPDGVYEFTARTDDGVRLWVDGERIIDNWSDHDVQTVSATRALGGTHTVIVEYYDNWGNAVAQVDWERQQ